jgi:hypothetical protein
MDILMHRRRRPVSKYGKELNKEFVVVAACKSSLWVFLGETRILFFAGMTLRFHCRGGEIGIIKVRAK